MRSSSGVPSGWTRTIESASPCEAIRDLRCAIFRCRHSPVSVGSITSSHRMRQPCARKPAAQFEEDPQVSALRVLEAIGCAQAHCSDVAHLRYCVCSSHGASIPCLGLTAIMWRLRGQTCSIRPFRRKLPDSDRVLSRPLTARRWTSRQTVHVFRRPRFSSRNTPIGVL